MEGVGLVTCTNCGAENPVNHAFCSNCGFALGRVCPNCQTTNEASNKFCFNCGISLGTELPAAVTPEPGPKPTSDPGERRLVSVLFADLVGFTTFSENRDPEDVRNMLTHFYEKCREIIGRYGGVTDKFIGDAVMGVWGAVEAHEDDAERATRAGLELVDMVKGLGAELGLPELAARAGVLSGSASVGSGGNEQGLVVGDLVNTASRLQSIASPGSVFVGSTTKDLVGSSIEFRPAGEQQVKGKSDAVQVFEATRVLALSTARAASDLLEGPFVGRDDELRLLKDQMHATGRENRARMVSIIGEGGIGKSRLAVELIRYIDGITENVYYHRGRSPSYGDGVTFWALGEMIRQRAGITEGEDPAKARMKLRTMVAEFAPVEEDQRWIEPRLAAVIGLAPNPPGERAEHFAALRAFFQAIAARGTVLMVFEDLHWADEGLLDFIEELVERTTADSILVLCLARPELLERRPDWAASRKRTLTMHLGRLERDSMRELVVGLAPGMPDAMVERIADRTGGVPLHAVEFVRMLLNTGLMERDGDGFRFTGTDEQIPIPDSVSAIIGARIDRLDSSAQAILRDASVLGLTFSLASLALLRKDESGSLEDVLRDLVRREILEFDENPRSPERGQYRFVQGLIREVAYGRLSRKERVARHLAVAEIFESANDPELAGVVASHYADAVDADPGNQQLVDRACRAVVEAAERAAGLKSDSQAAALYERAAEMTPDMSWRSSLQLRAAECLGRTGREDRGASLAREVLEWAKANHDVGLEMRAVTALSSATYEPGVAAELTMELFARSEKTHDADWIALAQETSRALMLSDRAVEALEVANEALPVMEDLESIEELLNTLINKGTALFWAGALVEGAALLRGVAELAADREMHFLRLRAINNLISGSQYDKNIGPDEAEELDQLTARVGVEAWAVRGDFFAAMGELDYGRLDRAMERIESGETYDLSEFWSDSFEIARLRAELIRDGIDQNRLERFAELMQKYIVAEDPQLRVAIAASWGAILAAMGEFENALDVTNDIESPTSTYPGVTEVGLYCAAALGDVARVRGLHARLVERHGRGRASRGLGKVALSFALAMDGDIEESERAFADAEDLWAKSNSPLSVALARAVFAIVAGVENEIAAVKAEQARRFFTDAGYKLYLEGIMKVVPDTAAHFAEDLFERTAISNG